MIDEISDAFENCMETVCVNVTLGNEKITVGCTYRAPNTDLNIFNEEFQKILDFLGNRKIYLCGDYNIDLLKNESHEQCKCFVDNMYSYGYYPLIVYPTRVTVSTSTLIDNIFTNMLDSRMRSGILVNDISDHLPIFTFNMNTNIKNNVKQNISSCIYTRQSSVSNVNKFIQSLENIDWGDVYDTTDIDHAYNKFVEKYSDAYNTACPIVKVKIKKKHVKPWLSKGLINAINKKESSIFKLHQV